MFKNSEIFLVYLVLRKAKAFALELAKAVVLTSNLLQDKVYRIVKLFLSNSQLRLTSNMSILYNSKEESFFRVPCFPTLHFLTLYLLPRLQESCPFADSLLQNALLCYI